MKETTRIQKKIEFLKEHDKRFSLFGSDYHKYQIEPRLTESEVREFEKREKVQLPQGYRTYLTEIGNGGAGPNYGIFTLEEARNGAGFHAPIKDFNNKSDEEKEHPGDLLIGQNGCGIFTWLRIVGPSSGQINADFRANNSDPVCIAENFLTWYESWLDEVFYEKGFIHHLSAKALSLGQKGQYEESLELFRLLVDIDRKDYFDVQPQVWEACLQGFCNVLYFLQKDNTGRPIDAEKNQYFLEKCLPYGDENPAIYFNAACVYNEMKDFPMVAKCLEQAEISEEIHSLMKETIAKEALFSEFRETMNP